MSARSIEERVYVSATHTKSAPHPDGRESTVIDPIAYRLCRHLEPLSHLGNGQKLRSGRVG